METTKNKSTLPVPLNDKALEIAKRKIAGRFPKDFLFVNPMTGSGYRLRYLGGLADLLGTEYDLYEATRHSYCTLIVPLTTPLTAQRLIEA